jgi:hypothetical protein
MLKELLHNKVYAILLFFFTLAILMWVFNYFGVYEGLTSATDTGTGAGAGTGTTAPAASKSVSVKSFPF